MQVSLIVCTRNRAARLPDFLDRLTLLEPPPGGWELILVDNASTDATPDIVERFGREAPFPVRCVSAGTPGLSRARNAGLRWARGEIIAFTDDDCYPRPDFLRALVAVFDEGSYGFVGGRTVLYDPGDAAIGVKEAETAMDITPRTFVAAGCIHGANMAVRSDVVRQIGGFDPLLGAGTACMAADDTEFIARAVWTGWTGRYDPRPVVAHHHGRKPGPQADDQKRGYDYGRGAYYTKFLLHARSRRPYLYEWYCRTARPLTWNRLRRLRREVAGGLMYLALCLIRREPVPDLSARPDTSHAG
jgi:glycosyltransferase involved in cell wall biosynthesis